MLNTLRQALSGATSCCLVSIFSPALRPDDPPTQALRKKIIVLLSIGVLVATLITVPHALEAESFQLWIGALFWNMFLGIVGLVWLYGVKSDVTDGLLVGITIAHMLGVFVMDMDASTTLDARLWILFIPLINTLVLCKVEATLVTIFMWLSLGWLLLNFFEISFRFGFYDLPGSPPHERRIMRTDCQSPPCALGILEATPAFVAASLVMVLDVVFITRFRTETEAEKAKMQATVEAAQRMTAFLTAFDLDGASTLLDDEGNHRLLPSVMQLTFRALIENLRTYRPYLPQSCLPAFTSDEDELQRNLSNGTRSSITASTELSASQVPSEREHGMGGSLRVAYAILNIRNSIVISESNAFGYAALHGQVITLAAAAAASHRGILDLFIGDHIHVTFNAFRQCSAPAARAAGTALMFRDAVGKAEWDMKEPSTQTLLVNAGISTGVAWCGDMGSVDIRRRTVIGKPPLIASALQQVAWAVDACIVADAPTYSDSQLRYDIRLILQTIEIRKHGTNFGGSFLFEVLENSESKGAGEEWMYELAARSTWESYNDAAKQYLTGMPVGVVRATLERHSPTPSQEPSFKHLHSLLDIEASLKPPLVITL